MSTEKTPIPILGGRDGFLWVFVAVILLFILSAFGHCRGTRHSGARHMAVHHTSQVKAVSPFDYARSQLRTTRRRTR